MKAALSVALVLLAVCTASQYNSQRNDGQQQRQAQKAQPFRAGNEYTFQYNAQIASGLDVTGPSNAPAPADEPQQNAMTRIQAQAKIAFETDQRASLRLEKIRLGQLNEPIESPQKVQPMGKFENKRIENEQRETLELPLQFNYNDGAVEDIQFNANDKAWSKNMKRAVLNLIQLNLKRQSRGQQQQMDSAEQQYNQQEESNNSPFKTFTLQETSIEGECQTTYSVNKNKRQQSQEQSSEEDRQQREEEQSNSPSFNVTKTIDFKKCQQISDVAFGYQNQQQQAQCAKCKQQQQAYGPQNQCNQECDPKEVKEQKLDRTTVARFVLNGKGPEQEYGIKRAELVSQYVYKNLRADSAAHSSAMRTVVAAELVFQSSQQKESQQNSRTETTGQKNSLLYDNEWDTEEKRFYMEGDESRRNSPFAKATNKVEKAQQIINKLAQSVSDKASGIEANDAVQLQRLVELLRQSTVDELKQLENQQSQRQSQRPEQQKAESIFADALAIAGTRNTIKVLSDMILGQHRSNQISPEQAAQSLKQLSGLPAPSDKQAEIVLHLCQNDVVHRNKALKQACWLSFGSMVGELCQQKTQNGDKTQPLFGAQSGYNNQDQCSQAKRQKYKNELVSEYKQAKDTYEKVLVLKAFGNAGIDTSVQTLEQVINDRQQSPIVRATAIDALRRLRNQMPRKIQRVLLPIMQNTREQPLVRMAAFSLIMQTTPDQPVVDQVAYALSKERNPQVQSLVYTALKALSKSKVPAQQQMAKHLKNTLKLSSVDEQTLKSSRLYQVPIYSDEQKEGAFISLVSAFANRNGIIPNHMAAVVDTLLNDEFEMNTLKVSLTQQGMEQWYEGLMQTFLHPQGQTSRTRGQRSSSSSSSSPNKNKLRDIFKGLDMKRRQSYRDSEEDDQQQDRQQRQNQDRSQPLAMVNVRIGDVDTAILPISSQTMPRCLKDLTNGQRPSLSDCLQAVQDNRNFRVIKAMNLNEKSAKIPTSAGIPLRILQAMPVLSAIEGQVKANPDRSEGVSIKAELQLHPSVCAVHIQKMETWSPLTSTGVQSTRAAELNMPIKAEIQARSDGTVKASVKPPTARTRIFGVHTLPSTYTREFEQKTHQHKEPKIRSIQVPQLEQMQREIDTTVGKQAMGMPVRIHGHVHRPANPTDYKQLLQFAMCTENHLHVHYEPTSDEGSASKEIVLRFEPSAYSKSNGRPSLNNFYNRDNQFDASSNEQEFENRETQDQRKANLNSYLDNFNGQMYKHEMKVTIETKGGRKQAKAEVTGSASCDAQFKSCRFQMDAKRTPMLANEKSDWNLQSQLQVLTPEPVSNVQQLEQNENQKNRKLIVEGEAEWGSEHKQSIKFHLQGEKAHTRQQRRQIREQHQGAQQKYQERQTAFINKFDLTADYKLRSKAQNMLRCALESLKNYAGFWNTQEEQPEESNPDGRIRASLVIDPLTQQHANVTVKCPNSNVRIESMELPIKVRPMPLVRPQSKASHSVSQLVSRFAEGQGRAQCTVDGKRVETFDDALYNAPIGKCYSVLAKDCSNEDDPQFAVMMKATGNGDDKKIKVVTPEQEVECQPTKSHGQKKLQCKVNGVEIDSQGSQEEDQRRQRPVEYNNEEQTEATINVKGLQVRFGCWGSQGCKQQKAWIKLSSQYKDRQCGLCGHYNDDAEDDLRNAKNEQTSDLQQFHRSYTLRNNQDEECNDDDRDSMYQNQQSRKFKQLRWDQDDEDSRQDDQREDQSRNNQQSDSQQDDSQQWDEDDDQWQAGNYQQDESSSEENKWYRRNNQAKKLMKKKGGHRQQKKNHQNSQDDQGNQNSQDNQRRWNQDEEPVEVTKVIEYNHKVCFSVKPVKQCQQGTYPADEQTTPTKIQFACMSRSDPETRQMQRQARKGILVEMSSQQPSFVESHHQPTRCVVY